MKLQTVFVLVLAGSMWQGSLVSASPASAAPVGEFTTFAAVQGGSSDPESIAAGPDGAMWFTEYASNKIGRLTPSGELTHYPVPTA